MSLGEYLGAGSSRTKLLTRFNGNSNDFSGNGYNGGDTAMTYSSVNGRFGQSGIFNGSTSGILVNTAGLTNNKEITMSIWIYRTDATIGNTHYNYFGRYMGIASDGNIVSPSTGGGLTYNHLYFNWNSGTWCGIGTNDTTSNILPRYKWTLVTVTRGSAGTPASSRMYINGNLIATTNLNSSAMSSKNTTICYGADYNFGPAYGFIGALLDEGIIERKQRTVQDVKKYYTYSKGIFGIL